MALGGMRAEDWLDNRRQREDRQGALTSVIYTLQLYWICSMMRGRSTLKNTWSLGQIPRPHLYPKLSHSMDIINALWVQYIVRWNHSCLFSLIIMHPLEVWKSKGFFLFNHWFKSYGNLKSGLSQKVTLARKSITQPYRLQWQKSVLFSV